MRRAPAPIRRADAHAEPRSVSGLSLAVLAGLLLAGVSVAGSPPDVPATTTATSEVSKPAGAAASRLTESASVNPSFELTAGSSSEKSATTAGKTSKSGRAAPPRLVVLIVVDQMRADYLDRFVPYFGERGFRRLMREGTVFTHARYTHATTMTGPGHAVVGAGAYADRSGIVGNGWIDRKSLRAVNCAVGPWRTAAVATVGGGTGKQGRPAVGTGARAGEVGRCPAEGSPGYAPASEAIPNPCNLKAKTLSERVKERFPNSRIVGIAMKDRAAILPAGKRADAAYWLKENEDETAAFTCDAYYPDCRAEVLAFNAEQGISEKAGSADSARLFRVHPDWRQWSCSLPAPCEKACPDDIPSVHEEEAGLGRDFPHPIGSALALADSPYGDDLLEGFAEKVVEAYALGKNPRRQPDVLTIGFSSPDYVGHLFGPDSCEVADAIKRLDGTLGRLLDFLARRVGEDGLLVVLAADHGVTPFPEVSLQKGIPAGRISLGDPGNAQEKKIKDLPQLRQRMEFTLAQRLGVKENGSTPLPEALILGVREPHLYLNPKKIAEADLPRARSWLKEYLMKVEGIGEVATYDELKRGAAPVAFQRAFDPDRSGDLIVTLQPGWIESSGTTGTTHGQPHDADARVPLLIWGKGIPAGVDDSPVDVARIAPTLAALLDLDRSGFEDPAPLPVFPERGSGK